MVSYPIHELERLTGIKAHTIRIWEKRFKLIEPERTETNRRFYNDEQVRKLLNVNTLMSKGYKISLIASLSDEEINERILRNDGIENKQSNWINTINDLVNAMITFDEAEFEKKFAASVSESGLFEVMMHVIYPFLNRVGILWAVDKTDPAREHFASNIIRRKLMVAIDGLLPGERTEKFLLFLPEGEWHEIGLLFANYILKSKGYPSLYLGQNVPMIDIGKITKALIPEFLLTFYITVRPENEIISQLNYLAQMNLNSKILVAGNKELLQTVKTKVGYVSYLDDVDSLFEYL